MPISEKRDTIDAISTMINLLGEMLESMTVPRDDLNTVINHVSDMVFTLDSKAVIVEINEAVMLQLGYSRNELIGKPIRYIQDQNRKPLSMTWFRKARSTKHTGPVYSHFQTCEKVRLLVEISIISMTTPPGREPNVLLWAKDKTWRPQNKAAETLENGKLAERYAFTPRQMEVLSLLVKNETSEDIAKELHVAKSTVENHRTNILSRADVDNTLELVKLVYEFE
jgi:PAS domain S-box-containing protein